MKRRQCPAHAVSVPIWLALLGSLQPPAVFARWQLVVDDGLGNAMGRSSASAAVFWEPLDFGTCVCGPLWMPPFQVWRTEGGRFADGFESGDTSASSATVP